MLKDDTLVRDTDKKEFAVSFHSHWSDIVSSDGETDYVKWVGGTGTGPHGAKYVSNSKGFGYHIKRLSLAR